MGRSLNASEVLVYRYESMPWRGTADGKDAGIVVDILNAVTKKLWSEIQIQICTLEASSDVGSD